MLAARDSLQAAVAQPAAEPEAVPAVVPPAATGSGPLDFPENASETFRNTSLLMAIRDAGFKCDDVVAAHRSSGGALWTANCRDLHGYLLETGEPGGLRVQPIPTYFDAVDRPVRLDHTIEDRRPLRDNTFKIDR